MKDYFILDKLANELGVSPIRLARVLDELCQKDQNNTIAQGHEPWCDDNPEHACNCHLDREIRKSKSSEGTK